MKTKDIIIGQKYLAKVNPSKVVHDPEAWEACLPAWAAPVVVREEDDYSLAQHIGLLPLHHPLNDDHAAWERKKSAEWLLKHTRPWWVGVLNEGEAPFVGLLTKVEGDNWTPAPAGLFDITCTAAPYVVVPRELNMGFVYVELTAHVGDPINCEIPFHAFVRPVQVFTVESQTVEYLSRMAERLEFRKAMDRLHAAPDDELEAAYAEYQAAVRRGFDLHVPEEWA